MDPNTEQVLRTLTDFASLNDREVFENALSFDSTGLAPGSYIFVLRGIIGETIQTLASKSLVIQPIPNNAPIANAGDNQEGFAGNVVHLDGSGSSDPDNDPIFFHWTFSSLPDDSGLGDADLVGSDTATPSFIPDVNGTYVISLVVNDGMLQSQTDTASIYVSPPMEVDLHPEKVNMKSNGGSKSVTVVLFSPLLSSFELLTQSDGITVASEFALEHSYVDLNGDATTFSTPVSDSNGDDFVEEVDLDGDGTVDGYQLTLKVDRQLIIDGFTDPQGNTAILVNTEFISTVLGNGIQINSDTNTALPP